MLTKVDSRMVHYVREAGANSFEGYVGGQIPDGSMTVFGENVLAIALQNGKPIFKVTPEGLNNWETVYTEPSTRQYRIFVNRVVDDKMYIALMENESGDAQPIYVLTYDLNGEQ